MNERTMYIFGNCVYAIGALLLILSVAAFFLSAGMVILAGPIVFLPPIFGGILFGLGRAIIKGSKKN